jgi:RNA polymerase sigma-70 factor, ECF subfamily
MSRSSPHATAPRDAELVGALRAGDESAFVGLVRAHHPVLLRVAMTCVPSRAEAEAVVRETWSAVLERLDGFDEGGSLRTWIVGIAADIARSRGGAASFDAAGAPPVDPERFVPADHPTLAGHWARPPLAWEARLGSPAEHDVIRDAIEGLPPGERLVVTLRDVGGWSAEETSAALSLTPADQRAVLHRARARVRAALERALGGMPPPEPRARRDSGTEVAGPPR